MEENSKLPSWLQDSKKRLIIVIVFLALIVYSFNTFSIARIATDSIIDTDQISSDIESKIQNAFMGTTLSGTYQNIYADETMTFIETGEVLYMYGSDFLVGQYELDGNYLYMNLNGYEYVFQVVERTNDSLVLNYGGYEYSYVKSY